MSGTSNRRDILAGGAAAFGGDVLAGAARAQPRPAAFGSGAPKPFSFEGLIAEAKALSTRPYRAPPPADPLLDRFEFDTYGQIVFDPK